MQQDEDACCSSHPRAPPNPNDGCCLHHAPRCSCNIYAYQPYPPEGGGLVPAAKREDTCRVMLKETGEVHHLCAQEGVVQGASAPLQIPHFSGSCRGVLFFFF